MGSRRSFVWTVCTPTVSRSENRPMCKSTRTAVDFASKCGSHAVSHCRLPGHSGDVFLFLLLTGPHGASATHSRMHWRVQVHAFEYPQSSLPVRPSAHRTFLGMSDDVSVDEVGILCYSAGLPYQEILWLRHQLSSRTISRRLFTELDRQLILPHRAGRIAVNGDIRCDYFRWREKCEKERRARLTFVVNVGATIRHLPCFRRFPGLVQQVLRFLDSPGPCVYRLTLCKCLWYGHTPFYTRGVDSFLEHLEERHLKPSSS